MSMTVDQRPNNANIHGAFEQLMFSISSTEQQSTSPQYYRFRYICDMYVGGNLKARVKVYPNANGQGIFRVDRLIQDFMSCTKADQNVTADDFYTRTIHNLGANNTSKIFSDNNGENYRKVEFKFGQEYSSDLTTDPTIYPDQITGEYVSVIMSAGWSRQLKTQQTWDTGIAYWNIHEDWIDTRYVLTDYGDAFLTDRFTAESGTTQTLGTAKREVIKVQNNGYYTLGFIAEGAAPGGSTIQSMYVCAYNSSNSLLASHHFILGTNGGTAVASVNEDKERLQYFGCGPIQMSTQTIDTGLKNAFAAGTVAYYEIMALNDTSSTPTASSDASLVSLLYRFEMQDCTSIYQDGDQPVTIAWQNSLGSWDYQDFTLRKNDSMSVKRKTFKQVQGNWDTAFANQFWNFRGDEGGERVIKTDATKQMTLTTDLLGKNDVDIIESIMLSPQVYLLANSGGIGVTPIIVTDTNFVRKSSLNERSPFLYQLKFKYAHNRPVTKAGTFTYS